MFWRFFVVVAHPWEEKEEEQHDIEAQTAPGLKMVIITMTIWCFYAAGQPDDPPSPGIGRARHSSKSSPTGSAQTELLLFSPGINIVIIITIIISMINQDRRPATDHRRSLTSSPTLPPAKPSASTFQAAQWRIWNINVWTEIDLGPGRFSSNRQLTWGRFSAARSTRQQLLPGTGRPPGSFLIVDSTPDNNNGGAKEVQATQHLARLRFEKWLEIDWNLLKPSRHLANPSQSFLFSGKVAIFARPSAIIACTSRWQVTLKPMLIWQQQ